MNSYDSFFIGGKWVTPAGTGTLDVISPATEEVVGRVPDATNADMDRAVAAAREAFDHGPWPRMSPGERADIMAAVSAAITERMDEFARLITSENGCPYTFSIMGQVFAATAVLDFFTGLTREFPFEETRQGMMGPTLVRHEPVGVTAGIIPWNVPLFITMLKMAPALASGSTMVLKPAPETPLDANVLAEILDDAGLPAGVVNIVPAGREVGEHLVRHPDVDKVSFTGSHRRRAQDRRHLRRAAEALHPRAGRQVGLDHLRGRRPGRRHPRPAARRHHEQRAGLRGPDPHPGPPQPLRRGA